MVYCVRTRIVDCPDNCILEDKSIDISDEVREYYTFYFKSAIRTLNACAEKRNKAIMDLNRIVSLNYQTGSFVIKEYVLNDNGIEQMFNQLITNDIVIAPSIEDLSTNVIKAIEIAEITVKKRARLYILSLSLHQDYKGYRRQLHAQYNFPQNRTDNNKPYQSNEFIRYVNELRIKEYPVSFKDISEATGIPESTLKGYIYPSNKHIGIRGENGNLTDEEKSVLQELLRR